MPAESRRWLAYAQENRHVAALSLESDLFNPCLQNAQQATEKARKALCLASGLPLKKTHSIAELRGDLLQAQADPGLSAAAADLLDTMEHRGRGSRRPFRVSLPCLLDAPGAL